MHNICDYNAKGDGRTNCTAAVQSAVDACFAVGGGKVEVPSGIYRIGTVILKSNVELHLQSGAVLLASDNCDDFPEREVKHVETKFLARAKNACIIYAEESENISITGDGVIDCNGDKFVVPDEDFWMPYRRIDKPTPPRAVFFAGCKNVKITDVTLRNSPAGWSYWIHDCDYVTFDRVKIFARVDYPNNDGIHINCSRNVTVSNSTITCGDDCIAVRANSASLKENKVCENVTVTNCTLTTWGNGVRIGWINDGTIRDCTFSNLTITDSSVGIGIVLPGRGDERLLDEGRESTLIENITFNNIVFDRGRSAPIWIDISDCKYTNAAAVRNITVNNFRAVSAEFPYICGRKDVPIKNLTLSDCSFEKTSETYRYGASGEVVFGDNGRHSLKIEYVENLVLNNVKMTERKV